MRHEHFVRKKVEALAIEFACMIHFTIHVLFYVDQPVKKKPYGQLDLIDYYVRSR